jgi:hypothetical protein
MSAAGRTDKATALELSLDIVPTTDLDIVRQDGTNQSVLTRQNDR